MSSPNPNLSLSIDDDIETYIRERIEIVAADSIPSAVAKEEERRFRQLKWFATLIGLVGLGTFGTLSNYLIEKAVDARLEARAGQISDSLDFIRFNSSAVKLELGTSFSNDDRASIMSYLRRTATNPKVRYTTEFSAALTQVLESFTSASQDSSIDEIVQLYEKELLGNDTMVEILLHHYGQKMVSRDVGAKEDATLKAFEKLEAVSSGARVGELALYYRICFTHQKSPSKPQAEVQALIAKTVDLKQDDLTRFFRELFQRTRAENWERSPSAEGRGFEKVTRSLLTIYISDWKSHYKLEEGIVRQVAEQGVEKEMIQALAESVASRAGKSRHSGLPSTERLNIALTDSTFDQLAAYPPIFSFI